jgi:hypothetical protein
MCTTDNKFYAIRKGRLLFLVVFRVSVPTYSMHSLATILFLPLSKLDIWR